MTITQTYFDEEGHQVKIMKNGATWWYDEEGYEICVSAIGEKLWHKNDQLHRDGDKPAMVWQGMEQWWKNGYLHRENNPAHMDRELNESGCYLEGYPYDSEEYWIRLLLMEY